MMDVPSAPRVSILIPNYNNGRESSADGRTDLIGMLLQSLHDTLKDDPTPFELLVYDDGSTDDSLATLREWSKKQWPNGNPFLELIEAPHCGVLSKNANVLSRKARGDIFARLDGDVTCLTPNWVSKLCEAFDSGAPRLGVIGPKQLDPQHRILAYGDWVLHPNGYSHVAYGMPRDAVKYPLEVDHTMGCFYCHRRAVYEELGGYDETFLRGQTIDFGLRARLAGWFCIAVPFIEFVHNHCLRKQRETRADSIEGVLYSLDVFTRKWGFHRLAADLDEVRQRYAGTPLLWNKQVFAALDEPKTSTSSGPLRIEETEWAKYAQDETFRKKIDFDVSLTLDVLRQVGFPPVGQPVVQVGSGTGLRAHLLASRGVPCLALDDSQANVEFARLCVGRQKYPGAAPRFQRVTSWRELPLPSGSAHMLVMFGQLEKRPNPVGLLHACRRATAPGGYLLLTAQRRQPVGDPSDPAHQARKAAEHRYGWKELLTHIEASGGWQFQIDPQKDDPRHDMIVVVQRKQEQESVAEHKLAG